MLAKPGHERLFLIFVEQCKTSFQRYWYLEQALAYTKNIEKRALEADSHPLDDR